MYCNYLKVHRLAVAAKSMRHYEFTISVARTSQSRRRIQFWRRMIQDGLIALQFHLQQQLLLQLRSVQWRKRSPSPALAQIWSSSPSTSSSLPQRVSSFPLREAFALAVAKSASVKKKTARIPAHLTKEHTMPLATALKTSAALDSVQIQRYDQSITINNLKKR